MPEGSWRKPASRGIRHPGRGSSGKEDAGTSMFFCREMMLAALLSAATAGAGWAADLTGLSRLTGGRVGAENALWIENTPDRLFRTRREVVVAELQGPAVVTMLHFALPEMAVAAPDKYTLGRELMLRMYWDGEESASVDVPMVDFFCDPAGRREQVQTALVNKRRGWNSYFPMPFRRSARILLAYEGPEPPGDRLWSMMPCYSYVMYRSVPTLEADEGYLHAQWRQRGLLLGHSEYEALTAAGRGKFVGWNVTVRRPGWPSYPVDMNENFFIDGETEPRVSFQGIEDAFGFSWGFPETENVFPLTGYWPFFKGAAAYRFFLQDAISFEKSLRLTIAFGPREKDFHEGYSHPGTMLQLSTTCYWYQTEPHAPFPPMPPPDEREPAPEQLWWPDGRAPEPSAEELKARGVRFYMLCGRPEGEVVFAEEGFAARLLRGRTFAGWLPPVYHCFNDPDELQIELTVPAGAGGTLRMFAIDADGYGGGRRQRVWVDESDLGELIGFREGRWLETTITPDMTADGRLLIRAEDTLPTGGNAVISIIEWIGG